ncbi:unnamed protein product [Euphydryas editha]|uniref:Nuclear speckle splicing regulatory protein 1 N-terminal domain-containing protein n=1 Tax=Euphydryas editha TaxID=104508 RepID=A0AAU9UU97_EUPED|nr:unnamed protein product [Euphydryas editha]
MECIKIGEGYGLIVRDNSKSKPLTFEVSRNVFGSDADSDDDKGAKQVLLQPSANINRQTKAVQEKAIIEDPTVYQYDEIYDSMSREKMTKKIKTQDEKKPRYIENLIKTANKRKLENERRVERQIQKEREKEGDEFADKEVFVTSAYKKKLEELRLEEEKEKYEDFLESIGDVTQQKDLGGFYRHLYEQKLGSDKVVEGEKNTSKKDEEHETENKKEVTAPKSSKKIQQSKQRNYRKRKVSNDIKLSEGEIEDTDDEIRFSNLNDVKMYKKAKANENIDADSDFSIDESSDEESNKKDETEVTSKKPEEKENNHKSPKQQILQTEENLLDLEELEKPKPKVDIWKKRTVGEVFEQALKRYYERKASRGG